jgi:hypothetical protein
VWFAVFGGGVGLLLVDHGVFNGAAGFEEGWD